MLAAACTSPNDTPVGVDALADASVTLGFRPPDSTGMGNVDISFAQPRLRGGCKSLEDRVTATFGGQPELLYPGTEVPGEDSGTVCTDPGVGIAPFSPSLAADAAYELVISDGTRVARMSAIGPYAPRTVTIDEGSLASGAPAHLHWTPASDVVKPYASGSAIGIVCYTAPVDPSSFTPLVFATTVIGGPNEVQLTASGTDLSFTMPATSYHGSVRCFVDASASVGVTACEGFATCAAPIILPATTSSEPTYVTPDALVFDTTI